MRARHMVQRQHSRTVSLLESRSFLARILIDPKWKFDSFGGVAICAGVFGSLNIHERTSFGDIRVVNSFHKRLIDQTRFRLIQVPALLDAFNSTRLIAVINWDEIID